MPPPWELPDFLQQFTGGGGQGQGPFAGLDEDQLELLRQINLIAEQFGLSAEGAAALITASAGGLLSESQAGQVLLGLDGDGGGAAASSAASMLAANASMMNAQENMRQGAFDRVADRLRLLQATDQLQDARRENAMAALIQAAPLLVAPGTEFSPGFEPGGPAMQLSNLIGANLQPPEFQTAPLPLGDFLAEERSVTPESINALLGGL